MLKLIALVLFFSGAAQAQGWMCPPHVPAWQCDRVNPNPIDRWPDRDIPGRYPRGPRGHAISCAPEVVAGNVAATDRVLASLAASPSFQSATKFRGVVSTLAREKTAVKVDRYFALIGVDARDSAAVAEFVGARDVRGSWLTSLEKSTGVSGAQAETVARELQKALRGSLQ
jgi:hypothetical protein